MPKMKGLEAFNCVYTGDQACLRWNIAFSHGFLSPGAMHILQTCNARWLMDLIGNFVNNLPVESELDEPFLFWNVLVKENGSGAITCQDRFWKQMYYQELDNIGLPGDLDLFIVWVARNFVITLPGEYSPQAETELEENRYLPIKQRQDLNSWY